MVKPPALAQASMPRRLFANIFGLQKPRDGARDGSSRRGRRYTDSEREGSNRDSSTHSALFDLELSSKGVHAAELVRLHSGGQLEVEEAGDPSVHLGGTLQRVVYLGRPLMEFELDLLQDLKSLREDCSNLSGLVLPKVLQELQYQQYIVELRRNNPTDPGYRHSVDKSCLEKLRHSYLVCHGRQDGSVQHTCIVDPRFREQFQVGHPTPAYSSLLKAVPVEFVGSPLRLQALVNLLCAEIAAAYMQQDLPLPPWRKASAMLSKWFTPADMAVGAAVAAGMLQPAEPPAVDSTAGEVQGGHEDGTTWQQGTDAAVQQPYVLPPLPPAGAQFGAPQMLATLAAELPRHAGPEQGNFPRPLSQGLPLPAFPLPSAAAEVSQSAREVPGPVADGDDVGGGEQLEGVSPRASSAPLPAGGPNSRLAAQSGAERRHSLDFFQALSLRQASLRVQQPHCAEQHSAQQQQASSGSAGGGKDARGGAGGSPLGVEGGSAPEDDLSVLSFERQQQRLWSALEEQSPLEAVTPLALPGGMETPDARLSDRTNRPRRRQRPGSQPSPLQQYDQQYSLWGPMDSVAAPSPGLPLRGEGGTPQPGLPKSWAELSTILETRSAQSSPLVGSLAEGGGRRAGSASASATPPAAGASSGSFPLRSSCDSLRSQGGTAAQPSDLGGTPVMAFAVQPLDRPSPFDAPSHAPRFDPGRPKAGKRVVSLLARGLKSMGQRQTWTSMLPTANPSVRRQGSSRDASMKGGARSSSGGEGPPLQRGSFKGGGSPHRTWQAAGGGGSPKEDLLPVGDPLGTVWGARGRPAAGHHKPPIPPR